MIYDLIDNKHFYFKQDEAIYKALTFAGDFDLSQADGRYEIDGDNLFALVMTYNTKDGQDGLFEAHKDYIDVQLILDGQELLNVVVEDNLKVDQSYCAEDDVILFNPPDKFSSMLLLPGIFTVLYPQDIHRPGRCLDGVKKVRKMVLKVRV